MVDDLSHGRVIALASDEESRIRSIDPIEFTAAHWDDETGRFWFLPGARELLIGRMDQPFRLAIPDIENWIAAHPEHTNVKDARTAFLKVPGTKGLSDTFEKVWQQKYSRRRGRPKKT